MALANRAASQPDAGPPADEAFLVGRARHGDLSAFEEIVRRHRRRVYGVALRIVRCHETAEDVAQEAFVRAWRGLERFELGRPFAPWVCRIAANLALNHVRSPRARGPAPASRELPGVPLDHLQELLQLPRRPEGRHGVL